jgi:hypothetical protein
MKIEIYSEGKEGGRQQQNNPEPIVLIISTIFIK